MRGRTIPKLHGKGVMVTGGAGFIGSHLVERLAREMPARLLVVDNFFLGRDENLDDARRAFPGLRVCRMDASDLAAMSQLAESERIDVVFNLAVIPLPVSLEHPVWTVETNVRIATTCCELARRGGIKTLIHCSSSEAYGTAQHAPIDEGHPEAPMTPYAASKTAGDHVVLSYCRTFGIDAAIARPFNNFGSRQNAGAYAGIFPIVARRVRQGLPVEVHGDGEQTRDFIFVRETADALVRMCEEESTRGKILNVGSGREVSVNALVAVLLRALGVPDHPVVHVAARPGDVRRHCAGIELARRLIGFSPQGITDERLRETMDWYRLRK